MITPANIFYHELIGLDTSIVQSNDKQLVGLNGKILDETKSMFFIQTLAGVKMIPKNYSTWQFHLDGMPVNVDGNTIMKRSYERMGVKA
ncbi:MAG: ribonuclease P protein subunit [Thaumarchaeota archaeon]|nr:ribonuclease P protein subunit [Nitrososphaerota archaeon]